jgi:PAS domain S-box-containing protein
LLLAAPAQPQTTRPNILFILADNVGWEDFGVHRGTTPTPRVDKLGSQGIRFNNYTDPSCNTAHSKRKLKCAVSCQARARDKFSVSDRLRGVADYGVELCPATDPQEAQGGEDGMNESEDQVRQIIDAIPALAWSASPSGSAELFNRRWLDYTGLPLEQARDWGWTVTIHPDDLQPLLDYWRSILVSHEPGETEARLRRCDAVYRWFLFRATPSLDKDGSVVKWYGTNTDIDDRKRAEDELRAAMAERARLAAVRAEIGIAFARKDSLRGILDLCAKAMVRHLDATFARIWTLNRDGPELELQASAGLYTRLDGSYSRIPFGKLKIGSIAQERKPHLTNDVQSDPLVVDHDWARAENITSFAGYPLIVEDRIVGVMGMFSRKSLTQETLDTLTFISDGIAQCIERKRAEEALRSSEQNKSSIDTGQPHDVELRLRRADGIYRWHYLRRLPQHDSEGHVIRWYTLHTDIHERKQAEEQLRRSEAKSRRLVEANVVGILMWTLDGAIIGANEAFLRMVQYSHEDIASGRVRWSELTPANRNACRLRNYLSLRSTRGVNHHTSWPGLFGGNSSKLIMQHPPFLNARLAWLPAPISRAANSLRSGSWPTTSTLVRLGRLARKVITSSGDPPGRIASQTSTGAFEASDSAIISAVSTARTSGLVTIQSKSNPIRCRPWAISCIFSLPSGTSGRCASSENLTLPRVTARPCRMT